MDESILSPASPSAALGSGKVEAVPAAAAVQPSKKARRSRDSSPSEELARALHLVKGFDLRVACRRRVVLGALTRPKSPAVGDLMIVLDCIVLNLKSSLVSFDRAWRFLAESARLSRSMNWKQKTLLIDKVAFL